MFLSGKAESGKSHVVKIILAFLRMSCNKCDIPFDSDIVKVTAFTGVAAAQFKIIVASTTHRAAHLNYKIQERHSSDCVNTILAFIDVISFIFTSSLEKVEKLLRIQTGMIE